MHHLKQLWYSEDTDAHRNITNTPGNVWWWVTICAMVPLILTCFADALINGHRTYSWSGYTPLQVLWLSIGQSLCPRALLFLSLFNALAYRAGFLSTRSTHASFGTADNSLDRENHIKGVVSSSSTQYRKSSLWLFPAALHRRTLQAGTHNGAANLPEIKKI